MKSTRKSIVYLLLSVLSGVGLVIPEALANVEYPADTIIDVTAAPYFADPSGVEDSTEAIQTAMDANDSNEAIWRKRNILYFPNGTYRLTSGLKLDTHNNDITGGGSGRGIIFQGESRDGVILKLDDSAIGFGDPLNPAVLVDFNEGNEILASWQFVGFQIHIKDMTLDVGSNNSGAIALDFTANNCGGLENLLLKSSDPAKVGHIGLLLSKIPGPQLFKGIEVDGFDYGIRTESNMNYQTTMEDILIRNSLINGIYNDFTSMTIHRLQTDNIGQSAVYNNDAGAFLVILNGEFINGNPAYPAVDNNGFLFARNLSMTGYSHLIEDYIAGDLSGPKISEWHSGTAESLFATDSITSLNLPVEDPPNGLRDPITEWVSVLDFGAARNNDGSGAAVSSTIDDAPAFQAAMNSMGPGQVNEGKRTLYLPSGQYIFKTGVTIPPHVERIVGCFSFIQPLGDAKDVVPCFTIPNGQGEPLIIEQLSSDWSDRRPEEDTAGPGDFRRATPFIKNESDRLLLLKDIWVTSGQAYKNIGGGKLFIQNVSGTSSRYGGITMAEPLSSAIPQFDFGTQDVWARQLNTEQKNMNVLNGGGDVWILGIKNEEDGTLVKTVNGGRSEILGGILMPLDVDNQTQPAFESVESTITVVIPGHTRGSPKKKPGFFSGYYQLFYDVILRETRGGETRDLLTVDVVDERNYYTPRPKVLTLFQGSVNSAAENWRLTHFDSIDDSGDAADSANPDGDLLTNLQERAFGRDPLIPESSNPISFELVEVDGSFYPAITYPQLISGSGSVGVDYTAFGIEFSVEYNTQLSTGTWITETAPMILHSAPDDQGNGTETVTMRTTVPTISSSRQFLRLQTVQSP